MLIGMSDPQQPPLPPYGSNEPQPAQPAGYPTQPAAASQQPHAQPVYAQPAYSPSAPTSPTDSNPMGRIGLIFGIVSVGLQVLLNVMIQIMIRSNGYQIISVISGVFSVIIFLAGVGALVFGILGIKRVGAPHAVAGIATGLGIAIVVGAGMNFVFNAISMMMAF